MEKPFLKWRIRIEKILFQNPLFPLFYPLVSPSTSCIFWCKPLRKHSICSKIYCLRKPSPMNNNVWGCALNTILIYICKKSFFRWRYTQIPPKNIPLCIQFQFKSQWNFSIFHSKLLFIFSFFQFFIGINSSLQIEKSEEIFDFIKNMF